MGADGIDFESMDYLRSVFERAHGDQESIVIVFGADAPSLLHPGRLVLSILDAKASGPQALEVKACFRG